MNQCHHLGNAIVLLFSHLDKLDASFCWLLSASWERGYPDLPACACGVAPPVAQCGSSSSTNTQDPREGPSLARWMRQDLLWGGLPRLDPEERRDLCKGHLTRFA